MTPAKGASLAATLAVLIALGPLPYGYYLLLRLLLCVVSLFLMIGARLHLEDWHRWTLGALAVLYNPIFPIALGQKTIWVMANLFTVIVFWIVASRRPLTS